MPLRPYHPLLAALLGLGLAVAPARATLQFLGHNPTGAGLARGIGYSSDFGPSISLTSPIPAFCNDSLFSQYVEKSNLAGYGYVRDSMWLAPAGSYGTSSPWARVSATNWVNSGPGIYGMSSDFYHSLTLRFAPGASGSAYFAVHWKVATVRGGGGSTFPYVQVNGVTYGGANSSGSGWVHFTVPLSGGTVAINVNGSALSQGNGLVVSSVEAELWGDTSPLAGVDSGPEAMAIGMAIAPNPARGGTRITFELPRAGDADVRLFDLQGREVRSLHRGSLPAGSHALVWDGRDGSGVAVNAGLYWARVASGGGVTQRRVVLTR